MMKQAVVKKVDYVAIHQASEAITISLLLDDDLVSIGMSKEQADQIVQGIAKARATGEHVIYT